MLCFVHHIIVMQDSNNDDIMVQGVTDEEKTFDSSEFGRLTRLVSIA